MKRFLAVILTVVLSPFVAAQKPPQIELGFKPEKAYALGDFDNVNLFNGNIIITIPLGLSYPVSSNLSYGLTLVYNSKIWDYKYYGDAFDPTREWLAGNPNLRSNAGMGWRVTMGRLLAPLQATNTAYHEDARGWVYESASGGEHAFVRSHERVSAVHP